ncbi:MAG: hypothetical protein ACKVS8_12940 [Phycisphaerales bacterium]
MSFFGPSIPPGVSGLDKGAARAAQDAARRKKQGAGKVANPGTSGGGGGDGDEVDLNVEGLSAAQAVRRAAGNAQEETAQDRREHPGYQAAKALPKPPPRPSLDVNG